jgi:hypothetical protein
VSNRVRSDGLLRPLTPPFGPLEQHIFSDTPSNIRANTVQLSGMRLSPASPSLGSSRPTTHTASPPSNEVRSPSPNPLKIEPSTPRTLTGPSALSVLIAESRAGSREASRSPTQGAVNGSPERMSIGRNQTDTFDRWQGRDDSVQSRPHIHGRTSEESEPSVSETAPLLVSRRHHSIPVSYSINASPPAPPHFSNSKKSRWTRVSTLMRHFVLPSSHDVLNAIPAVVLGLLLNILDGISYGMIVFPASGVFAGFGGTGVSMFFVT